MRLPRPAVRPALSEVTELAVGSQVSSSVDIGSASLELLFNFQVFKVRDQFEPATLALDFANQQFAVEQ